MAHARSIYPTLLEILRPVKPLGGSGGAPKTPVSTIDGLTMKPVPNREGLITLSPEQLCSIRVPVRQMESDRLIGYQRHLTVAKARKFARFLVQTPNYIKVLPVAEVSIDGNGNAFWTDGQHRGAGAVIARKDLRVVLTKRTEEEARKLFALQVAGSKPSRNVLILDGDGPFEEYIQDAVTDPNHPWHGLVTMSHAGSSKTKMSATAAFAMLRVYVARTSHMSGTTSDSENGKFNRKTADELALLVATFGTKATNRLAFNSLSLRAIAETARSVFRERDPHPDDRERWVRHMSKFNFAAYQHLNSHVELADRMKKHWNKHLTDDRKVSLA
jgi:hypothetical protein